MVSSDKSGVAMKGKKRFLFYSRRRKLLGRLDVWPFLIGYSLLAYWLLSTEKADKSLSNGTTAVMVDSSLAPGVSKVGSNVVVADNLSSFRETLFQEMFLVVLLLVHVVFHLTTHWSVGFNCFIVFKKVDSAENSTHVKVIPDENKSGQRSLLCPLQKTPQGGAFINYLKKRLIFDSTSASFLSTPFPVNLYVEKYKRSEGLSSPLHLQKQLYGENNYDIPRPEFWELLKEHFVAPFFVFQLVCVLLWMLDDYWYYSLMTLVMLIFLEMQLAKKRQKDTDELRKMRLSSRGIRVCRDRLWSEINSDELLPGDLVAILREDVEANNTCLCDMLLLSGTVVMNEAMLTGESIPQMKTAVVTPQKENSSPLDIRSEHKQHVLFAGTKVLMHKANECQTSDEMLRRLKPPKNACVGYVLRTGFQTTQGKLVRTILFSHDKVGVTSVEALLFLSILLVFAILAAAYVLHKGLERGDRNRFKLLLSCSHIITAVVPPEFPITLTLAVTLSLLYYVKRHIFCTEPFRVPLAGKVDVCAFDKTGTLTSDQMVVVKVDTLSGTTKADHDDRASQLLLTTRKTGGTDDQIKLQQPLPFATTAVLAGCHSLALVDGTVVGDPMEKASLHAVDWKLLGVDVAVSGRPYQGTEGDKLTVLHRWPFVAEMSRMTVLSKHQGPRLGLIGPDNECVPDLLTKPSDDAVLVLVKGSPEKLKPLLAQVPDNYAEQLKVHTMQGYRTLALAAKWLPMAKFNGRFSDAKREDVEANLTFTGFLILACPIKNHTLATIATLQNSYHNVMMVTGDNTFTACQVASQVGIARRRFLILKNSDTLNSFSWCDFDGERVEALRIYCIRALSKRYALCIPGDVLGVLSDEQLKDVVQFVCCFSRVSPQQKERVILSLRKLGLTTLMCGDGTNDVGALKAADVGVSIPSSRMVEVAASKKTSNSKNSLDSDASKKKMRGLINQMQQEAEVNDMPIVRLGDASIASPFTCKDDTIRCVTTVLKGGRATLATVLQLYKIMFLNSITTAFALSVLTIDGVKLGDAQATIENLYISFLFFFVSQAQPSRRISPERPTSSVFRPTVIISLVGQTVLHIGTLIVGWRSANAHRDPTYKPDVDGVFSPNITNTVVYYIIASMHASTFLANYEGAPFMTPFFDNKFMLYGVGIFLAALGILVTEVAPSINQALELVPLPNPSFKRLILLLVLVDVGGAWLFATAVSLFSRWFQRFFRVHGISLRRMWRSARKRHHCCEQEDDCEDKSNNNYNSTTTTTNNKKSQ